MSEQVVLLTMLVSFGSVSEGLKETGCKPVGSAYVGSNPTAPIFLLRTICAGVAQLVEHRPSKPRVASSSLVSRSITAHVAQLVEHTLGKGEVTGSSPVMGLSLFSIFFIIAKAMIS